MLASENIEWIIDHIQDFELISVKVHYMARAVDNQYNTNYGRLFVRLNVLCVVYLVLFSTVLRL